MTQIKVERAGDGIKLSHDAVKWLIRASREYAEKDLIDAFEWFKIADDKTELVFDDAPCGRPGMSFTMN